MTINAFAWIYDFVSGWMIWVQALPPWRAVKRSFDDFIRWGTKCMVVGLEAFPNTPTSAHPDARWLGHPKCGSVYR